MGALDLLTKAKQLAILAVSADADRNYPQAVQLYYQTCLVLHDAVDCRVVETPRSPASVSTITSSPTSSSPAPNAHAQDDPVWISEATSLIATYERRLKTIVSSFPVADQVVHSKFIKALQLRTDGTRSPALPPTAALPTPTQTKPATLQVSPNAPRENHPSLGPTPESWQIPRVPALSVAPVSKLEPFEQLPSATQLHHRPLYASMSNLSRAIVGGGFISPTVYLPTVVWQQERVKFSSFAAKLQALRELANVHVVQRLAGVDVDNFSELEAETRLRHITIQLRNVRVTLTKSLPELTASATDGGTTQDIAVQGELGGQPINETGEGRKHPSGDPTGPGIFDSLWKDVRSFGQLAYQGAQKGATSALQKINQATNLQIVSSSDLEMYRNAVLDVCAEYLAVVPKLERFVSLVKQQSNIHKSVETLYQFYAEVLYRMVVQDVKEVLSSFVQANHKLFVKPIQPPRSVLTSPAVSPTAASRKKPPPVQGF